jgi:hypothetical protein
MLPEEAVSRWRDWRVKGTAGVIADFFSRLNAHLPGGWRGSNHTERHMETNGETHYTFETPSPAEEVTLSVDRWGESGLRPGFVKGRRVKAGSYWNEVMRFLDEGIVPAAQAVGAEIRVPSPGDFFLSDLPSDARDQLRTFSKTARKSLPLNNEETEQWRGFVIAFFRAKAVIDPALFADWLVNDGWSIEAAADLTNQFFDLCRFLSRFQEEAPAA